MKKTKRELPEVVLMINKDATLVLTAPAPGRVFSQLAVAIETAAKDCGLGEAFRDGLKWSLDKRAFRSLRRRQEFVRFISLDTRLTCVLEFRGHKKMLKATAWVLDPEHAEKVEEYRELTAEVEELNVKRRALYAKRLALVPEIGLVE